MSQKRIRREDGARSRSGRGRQSGTAQDRPEEAKPELRAAEAAQAGETRSQAAQTEAAKAEAVPAASAEAAQPGERGSHSGSHGSRRRRRYHDYGTVSLGSLEPVEEEERDFTEDPNGPTPTQGELQRQFYRKYDAILSRRYFTRNRAKVTRMLMIVLLAALIFVVAFFGFSSLAGNTDETLEKPVVSTIPVETFDLG